MNAFRQIFRVPLFLVALVAVSAGCRLPLPLAEPSGPAIESVGTGVYLLRSTPDGGQVRSLGRVGRLLILVPGVSSGDLDAQGRFLSHLRLRTRADVAVFHHWGQYDPARRMAAPLATAQAAGTLAAFCEAVSGSNGGDLRIDVVAHSAGTIVVNKMALHLDAGGSPLRLRHVLFLGTPHDPAVDLRMLRQRCDALLNLHSAHDKINRNVSGDAGALAGLSAPPYWNRAMDTSLGGRRMRHYAFLEDTPENRVQYSHFLRTGRWPEARPLPDNETLTAVGLHRHAMYLRTAEPVVPQAGAPLPLLQRCLTQSDPEIRYYGALLAGLAGDDAARPWVKAALEAPGQPDAVRRELYQALGAMENPDDLRYLQERRASDPAAGDVLRDVLRDWKRKRIRPARPAS